MENEKFYDEDQNKVGIPLHILVHDANDILLQLNKPHLEFVDIYLKKSTNSDFGDALNFNSLSAVDFESLFYPKIS